MLRIILRFGARQFDCRFFFFSVEKFAIPLRVNDLRTMPVKMSITRGREFLFATTTIKRIHNSLRIRTYRSVDSRELKAV